eukprot:scaffold6322_cov59-Cylindrotheca_fusiformis.AAC.3
MSLVYDSTLHIFCHCRKTIESENLVLLAVMKKDEAMRINIICGSRDSFGSTPMDYYPCLNRMPNSTKVIRREILLQTRILYVLTTGGRDEVLAADWSGDWQTDGAYALAILWTFNLVKVSISRADFGIIIKTI